MKKNILVIAAHPDDEILGCGATMARHVAEGDHVRVLLLAEGITSRGTDAGTHEKLVKLHATAKKANALLGVTDVIIKGFPDNKLDSIPRLDVIQSIESLTQDFHPHTVYTHHFGDLNIDHRRVNDAVLAAFRPLPKSITGEILFFEVPSSTDWGAASSANSFIANFFVNIDVFLAQKIAALNIYESEMRQWPHARSYRAVEALAHWRGASVGIEAAEAFMLGRKIV